MRIFCTYTAMLALREELAKITDVERVSLMTATHTFEGTPASGPNNGKTLRILQLYPLDMNIYGDWGNTWRWLVARRHTALTCKFWTTTPVSPFPEDVDIILGGGGQDSGQSVIQDDLHAIGGTLRSLAEDGVPMLVICGLYQLFGREFRTREGEVLKGINIFDAHTVGGDDRLIGNIVEESEEFGTVIGFENHSGLTYLGSGCTRLRL